MFEPHFLPGVLEVFCDADHAVRLGNARIQIWSGSHVESAFDQGRERSAEHDRIEQWRVGILRVAQG